MLCCAEGLAINQAHHMLTTRSTHDHAAKNKGVNCVNGTTAEMECAREQQSTFTHELNFHIFVTFYDHIDVEFGIQ